MLLKIVPLGNVSPNILLFLKKRLPTIYSLNVEISEPLPPPEQFYDFLRKQWIGERILHFLAEKCPSDICVGIISEDMYASNLNFIFGIASSYSKCCIVSTARLKGNNFYERLLKEVMHELGHVFGLRHCLNRCVMRFSNSLAEVDVKPAMYCEDCRKKIKEVLRW